MVTDTIDSGKELIDSDECQYNLIRLRDELDKKLRSMGSLSITDPEVVILLKINSCLYRDRHNKLKNNTVDWQSGNAAVC